LKEKQWTNRGPVSGPTPKKSRQRKGTVDAETGKLGRSGRKSPR